MATKYVDHDSGDNTNTGDSLADAYATVQKALDVRIASELSVIYIKGDATGLASLDPETGIGVPTVSASPIQFIGLGNPELNFGTNDMWSITTTDAYSWRGCTLTTVKDDNTYFIRGDDFVDITGCHIKGVSGNTCGGIVLNDYSKIRGNLITDVSSNTLFGGYTARYGTVEQNIVFGHTGNEAALGWNRSTTCSRNFVKTTGHAFRAASYYSTVDGNVGVGSGDGIGLELTVYGGCISNNYMEGFDHNYDLNNASFVTFFNNWSFNATVNDFLAENADYPVEQNVATRSFLKGITIDHRLMTPGHELYWNEYRKYFDKAMMLGAIL